ncbi:hypothetical protein XI06_13140 [Bradyrhizobium sp. CCBAU 11434]|nr:hypothetical protein [Bradyrhizobium sp. CCBAU 11434]
MAAGAAEAVIEVEMAERGIEVIPPHQPHHAPPEPDAFGITCRPVDGLGGLGEFVGAALVLGGRVLGGVGRLGGGLALVGRGGPALGGGATEAGEKHKGRNGQRGGELPQDRIS